MSKKTLILIIFLLTAVVVGAAFFFLSAPKAEKQKAEPQPADSHIPAASEAPIPMRILINTSEESNLTVGGENFISGEWKHVSEEWFQKNAEALKKYSDIKEAQVILEEKLAGIPEEKLKEFIEENSLKNFAQGLKDTAETYHQPVPAIAETILRAAP